MAQYVFSMNHLTKTVPPKRQILKDISLSFFPGAKIGVLGLNGSGKSSLLKIMAGVDKEFEGEAIPMAGLSIGYLPQEPQLNPEHTVREAVEEAMAEVNKAKARLEEVYAAYAEEDADFDALAAEQGELEAIIAAAGTDSEHQLEIAADALRLPPWDAVVGKLSGGEKRRVALCKLLLSKPDMLLLDEPTNHLDLATREALAMALNEFEGTVMLVSHDRALLRSVCDEFWMVSRGGVEPFDGDLDDYQKYLLDESKRLREEAKNADRAASAPKAIANSVHKKDVPAPSVAEKTVKIPTKAEDTLDYRSQRKQDAQSRQGQQEKTRPLKKELEQIDKRMTELQTTKTTLEERLTQPMPPAEIADNGKRLKAATDEIAKLEERWLEVSSELEALTA